MVVRVTAGALDGFVGELAVCAACNVMASVIPTHWPNLCANALPGSTCSTRARSERIRTSLELWKFVRVRVRVIDWVIQIKDTGLVRRQTHLDYLYAGSFLQNRARLNQCGRHRNAKAPLDCGSWLMSDKRRGMVGRLLNESKSSAASANFHDAGQFYLQKKSGPHKRSVNCHHKFTSTVASISPKWGIYKAAHQGKIQFFTIFIIIP